MLKFNFLKYYYLLLIIILLKIKNAINAVLQYDKYKFYILLKKNLLYIKKLQLNKVIKTLL